MHIGAYTLPNGSVSNVWAHLVNPMANVFDVKLRGLPNQDLVVGFPGISASWPRIEGSIEIRSKDPASSAIMSVVYVAVALYRTDCIHPPSNKPKPGIAIPKKDQSYLIGEKIVLFDTKSKSHDLIGMDLPFVLPLPTNRTLPSSISLGKGTASVQTTYQLFVSLIYGAGSGNTTLSSSSAGAGTSTYHFPFPVRIKRYDTLSTFGAYRVPIVLQVTSADHLVSIDFSSPTSSFGPGDLVLAYLSIRPNPDWPKSRKVKLQRLTMQIVEVVQFEVGSGSGDEEPLIRKRRLAKCAKQLDLKLSQTEPYSCDMSLEFPSAELVDKDGSAVVPKGRQDVPLSCCKNGFTTVAALYQIKYVVIVKARFSHCKDVTIEQPITVTPFDHVTCMSFMKCIADAVNQVNRAEKPAPPPPKLYRSSDQSDMWTMGRMPSTVPGSKGTTAILLN